MTLQRLSLGLASALLALGIAGVASAQTAQATIAEGRCQRMLSPGQTYPGPWNVLFDTGKSVVRPNDKAELKKIAQQAKTLYVTRICLIGTADRIAARLEETFDAGASSVFLQHVGSYDPPLDLIEAIGGDVLPRL